jgi:hypothetical protein
MHPRTSSHWKPFVALPLGLFVMMALILGQPVEKLDHPVLELRNCASNDRMIPIPAIAQSGKVRATVFPEAIILPDLVAQVDKARPETAAEYYFVQYARCLPDVS